MRWIVGISGASGTVYARRLLQELDRQQISVELVISEGAIRVLHEEENIDLSRSELVKNILGYDSKNIRLHNNKDTGASIASGSYQVEGMIVIPCSMNTLAAIAHGLADNLIRRAADVTIKERRRLIIVPRETPLSLIHLKNLVQLAELGVSVVPAMPGFYGKPEKISDLVDHFVMRVLDQMNISNALSARWKE